MACQLVETCLWLPIAFRQYHYHEPTVLLLVSQAMQLDSHLAEYVPHDILSTTEGISYDLDVNELMVGLPVVSSYAWSVWG